MGELENSKTKKRLLFELFFGHFKAMLFAFTGGNVALPLIQSEIADKYMLLDRAKIVEYYSVAQAIPGAISINCSILVGRHVAGWAGALAASFGVIFPAFVSMLLISILYVQLKSIEFIDSATKGIRVSAVAIIFTNAVAIAKYSRNKFHYLLILLSFVAIIFFHVDVVLLIIFSGILGIFYKKHEKAKGGGL